MKPSRKLKKFMQLSRNVVKIREISKKLHSTLQKVSKNRRAFTETSNFKATSMNILQTFEKNLMEYSINFEKIRENW